MSVVTKLFVVLATVLAVLLVALIVPYVANTEKFREQEQQLERQVNQANAAAALAQSQLATLQSEQNKRELELLAEKQVLTSEINRLKNELASTELALKNEKNNNARIEADFSRLTAANAQNADLIGTLQSELAQSREQLVTSKTRNIELVDSNNELASAVETMERQVRFLKEENVEQEQQLADKEAMLNKLDQATLRRLQQGDAFSADVRAIEPAQRLEGQITAVESVGDETFVQINIGRSDDVERNMKFRVHRGSQFLGRLIITAVDANSAAGRIELNPGIEIQAGDRVQTGGFGIQ